MTRMQELYKTVVSPALTKEFGYKNPMQVPRLEKIVVNMGVGEAAREGKKIEAAIADVRGVTDLQLEAVDGGANLVFSWTDTTDADEYLLFAADSPEGAFTTVMGTAASGLNGLTLPMPSTVRFFLVAGVGPCGVGPK